MVQRLIRERLLLPVPLSPIVYSDVPGRSAEKNAAQHLDRANVGSADIRDCYNSMTNAMVFRVFRHTLRLGDDHAGLLTRLTTLDGHVPHGAPTSGALANLILSPLDVELERTALAFELTITRYVDNIDFSGQRTHDAFLPIIAAVQALGFAVKRKKVFNAGGRRVKIVTGRTVSGPTLRLPRSKRANVRANVHELLCRHRDGLPIADRELRRVEGRLHYLRTQGHPREAERLSARLATAGIAL
jgi:RNA-directed DNA polymerase